MMRVSRTLQPVRIPADDRRMRCTMTCSCVEDETGAYRMRYGLVFKKESTTILAYPDLSGNASHVRELMTQINKNRVSPIHIGDIIDDFLVADAS